MSNVTKGKMLRKLIKNWMQAYREIINFSNKKMHSFFNFSCVKILSHFCSLHLLNFEQVHHVQSRSSPVVRKKTNI